LEGRGKKILFGCLGGCGFTVLMAIGSCVGFTMWLNSPAEVLEPQVLLGPETTGYIEWTLRLEDSGTAEFVEGMLQGLSDLNDQSDSPLPDGLQQLFNVRQMKSARKDLKKLFPLVVAWTTRPGDRLDEDEHLFAASARGLGHRMVMLDWVLGFIFRWADDIETVRHHGEKIYVFGGTGDTRPACFVNKGIVFVATDLDSARAARDRLGRPADGSTVSAELGLLFDELPQDHALRGALTNRRGELRRILEELDLPAGHTSSAALDDVHGATVVATFRDQEVFAGVLELRGPSADWAQTHSAKLGAALEAMFERSEIEFATEARHSDDRIQIEFSTTNLFDQIEAARD